MSAAPSASIESSVKDHISLILAGKALEGLEKYYAEDAVMQENDQPPRDSKATNRAFEQDFFSKVTTVRTLANDGYVVSGNRAFVVWRVDIDHAEWGAINNTQVAIQEWNEGRGEPYRHDDSDPERARRAKSLLVKRPHIPSHLESRRAATVTFSGVSI